MADDGGDVRESIAIADQHRSPPLTLQDLPPEILSEIFLFWLHPSNHPSVWRWNPLLLCRVCGSWRAIAFATPGLWVDPRLTLHTDQVTDAHCEVLSEFLARSNAHPFSLYLGTFNETTETRDAYKLLETILPFASRIVRLALDLPQSAHRVLQSTYRPAATFPLLEFVDIVARNADYNDDMAFTHEAIPILDTAPLLRKIVLSDGSEDRDGLVDRCDGSFLHHFSLPWSQITTLNAENIFGSPDQARLILCQCISLEWCTLGGIPTWQGNDAIATLPFSTLSHLDRMEVTFEDDHYQSFTAFFFQPLQLPALTTLHLTAPSGHDQTEIGLYMPFLFNKIGTTLTHLRIVNLRLSPIEVIPILSTLPVLEYLEFGFCHVATDDLFFDALDYEGSTSPIPLVPSLQFLEIREHSRHGLNITPDAVVLMVLGRWWSDPVLEMLQPEVARWRSVRISWDDEEPMVFDEVDQRTLDRCREEGLCLSIS